MEPWTSRGELTMCFPLDPEQRKGIARRRQQIRDYRLGTRLSTLLWRDDGTLPPGARYVDRNRARVGEVIIGGYCEVAVVGFY
jgi:hypothetical protein